MSYGKGASLSGERLNVNQHSFPNVLGFPVPILGLHADIFIACKTAVLGKRRPAD